MSERLVAAFRGLAICRREVGAVAWSIRGTDRESGDRLEVLLCGAVETPLPAQSQDAAIYFIDASSPPHWEWRSSTLVLPLIARAVQIHRDASANFFRVLPKQVAPMSAKWGWVVLLNLLRAPGAVRWLRRLTKPANDHE